MIAEPLLQPKPISQEALRKHYSLPVDAANIMQWVPQRGQAWLRYELDGKTHEQPIAIPYA